MKVVNAVLIRKACCVIHFRDIALTKACDVTRCQTVEPLTIVMNLHVKNFIGYAFLKCYVVINFKVI